MNSIKVSRTKKALYTRNPLLLIISATLGLSASVLADHHGVTTDEAMETVTVTASRNAQTIDRLAASLSVVSAEDLAQVQSTHINESLARVAGVWASRGNGQESLPAIRSPSLTGAGSCGAFYIAEDSVPVRPTGFCNVNQLFDTNSEQAERIDVLKGPGNALHGSGAMHGVINVLSASPSSTLENNISLESGPHSYGRVKISHSNAINGEGNTYRISFNGTSDGGYKDESGFDQQKLSLRHDYVNGDYTFRTLFSASNLNQETAGYVEGTDAYKDSDRKKENPNPEAFRDSKSFRLQTRISKTLANGTFILTPYARSSDMTFLMHFLPGTPLEENGQNSVGFQASYHRAISEQFSLTNGFDAEYTDAYLKQSQGFGFSSFPSGRQYDYDVNARVLAAFLDANFELSSDTTLAAGTRYEYIDYEYDNKMIAGNTAEDGSQCVNGFTGAIGCRYSRPEDRSDDFGNWSLNAGLVHRLSNETTLVSRISHGFRAPQATELYRLQAGQLSANLDPEEIDSFEIGIRGNSEGFSYHLTAFVMDKSNVIFQDSARLNTDEGSTEHYGIEYEFYKLLGSFDITLSGTIARHKYTDDVTSPGPGSAPVIDSDGKDIDTAPRHMGSLQIGWQVNAATRAELEWVSMGRYYTDINNLHSYSGHDLLNLRFQHQFNNDLSMGLRITNLADEDYAERADYSSFNGDRYFIGEPRSIYADVRLSF